MTGLIELLEKLESKLEIKFVKFRFGVIFFHRKLLIIKRNFYA